MGNNRIRFLNAQLNLRVPLIGDWLRPRAARQLARDGSPEALHVLAEALASNPDEPVRQIAIQAIRHANSQPEINAICEAWLSTRFTGGLHGQRLEALIEENRWVGNSSPRVLVFSALKANRLESLTTGGADRIDSLLLACRDPEASLAERARRCLTRLQNPAAIDRVCEIWAASRDLLLEQALIDASYIAQPPGKIHVLSALKTGQLSRLADEGPEILSPLLEACTDTDSGIAKQAKFCLAALHSPAAVDALCQRWAETRDPFLGELLQTGAYVAQQPAAARVLSALFTNRPDLIREEGAEIAEALCQVFGDRDAQIAARARQVLGELKDSQAREVAARWVGAQWVQTRSAVYEDILCRGQYVAEKPLNVRVLSALKIGKLQRLHSLEPKGIPLLLQACTDPDPEISARAVLALAQIKKPETIDAVCQQIIAQSQPVLLSAALAGNYAPQETIQRALFFFLTRQDEKYQRLDFDSGLLRAAYEAADPVLRERIRDQIRITGRSEILSVITGGVHFTRVSALTPVEIAFLVKMLTEKQEWARLWARVFELPPEWGLKIVQALAQQSWEPPDEVERRLYTALRGLTSPEVIKAIERLDYPFPPAICQAQVRLSAGRVNEVSFSPLRPLIALGTSHRKVLLWNFQTAAVEQTYRGFAHSIGVVAFARNGRLLFGERTSAGAACSLYSVQNSHPTQIWQQAGSITAIEPIGDSQVLVAGHDQEVRLLEVATHPRLVTSKKFDFWARSICAAYSGQHAALLHNGLSIVELPGLKVVAQTLQSSWKGISRRATFLPDGMGLIVGKYNGEVIIVRGRELKIHNKPLAVHAGQVQGVEALAARSVIVSASSNNVVQFTTFADQAPVGRVQSTGTRLTSLHISPDGSFMALGDSDTSISFWDLRPLDIPHLLRMPLVRAVPNHLAALRVLLKSSLTLPAAIHRLVRFVDLVLQHRFRFEIELAEETEIKMGEFDIEIE